MNTNGENKSRSLTIADLKQMIIDSEETIWSVAQLAELLT